MLLVSEQEREGVRIRMLACDECEPYEDCTTRFLVFQAGHEQLWVTLVWLHDDDDDAEQLDLLFDGIEDVAGIVERYTALAGMTWPVLACNGQACMDQILVCRASPEWMLRVLREDVGLVWQTRRVVFGRDLTRVHRALSAMHRAYVPDSFGSPERIAGR